MRSTVQRVQCVLQPLSMRMLQRAIKTLWYRFALLRSRGSLRLNVTAEKLRGFDESGGCRRPAAAPQFDNAEMRRLRKPFPEFQLNEIPLPFGPRMNVWRNEDHVAS